MANCAHKHFSVIQGGSSVTHAFTNDWVCIVMRCPLTLFANARLTYEETKGKLPSNKRHSSSLWKLIKISLRMHFDAWPGSYIFLLPHPLFWFTRIVSLSFVTLLYEKKYCLKNVPINWSISFFKIKRSIRYELWQIKDDCLQRLLAKLVPTRTRLGLDSCPLHTTPSKASYTSCPRTENLIYRAKHEFIPPNP